MTLKRQPSLHYFHEIGILFFFRSLLTAGSFQNPKHKGVRRYYKGLIPSKLLVRQKVKDKVDNASRCGSKFCVLKHSV